MLLNCSDYYRNCLHYKFIINILMMIYELLLLYVSLYFILFFSCTSYIKMLAYLFIMVKYYIFRECLRSCQASL